jgi:hypothetical protein
MTNVEDRYDVLDLKHVVCFPLSVGKINCNFSAVATVMQRRLYFYVFMQLYVAL